MECSTCKYRQHGTAYDMYIEKVAKLHQRYGRNHISGKILTALRNDQQDGEETVHDGLEKLTKMIKTKPELDKSVKKAEKIQTEIDEIERKIKGEEKEAKKRIDAINEQLDEKVEAFKEKISSLKDVSEGYVKPEQLAEMKLEKAKLDKLLDAVDIAKEVQVIKEANDKTFFAKTWPTSRLATLSDLNTIALELVTFRIFNNTIASCQFLSPFINFAW